MIDPYTGVTDEPLSGVLLTSARALMDNSLP